MSALWELGEPISIGLGPGGGGVQCQVSGVQGKEQNQEHEEKGRRRKLNMVTPSLIDPLPVQGVFFTAPGAGEGGSDVW